MKEIQLTQGKVALIDDEDFDKVSKLKWHCIKSNHTYYASTNIWDGNKEEPLRLHWLIIGKPDAGFEVDHKDRDGLNNQKDNLRVATKSQNRANRETWGRSKYNGVSIVSCRAIPHWRAFLGSKYLGIFKSEKDAALTYNKAAKEKYGEFAKLNIIEENERY